MAKEYKKQKEFVIGYLDKTDFDFDLGFAGCGCWEKGAHVYPTLKGLKQYARHDPTDCGIVQVEIRLKRVVQRPKYERSSKETFKDTLVRLGINNKDGTLTDKYSNKKTKRSISRAKRKK